ncbi:MAG: sulfite exporter TauE/SafE family protein [Sulfobacillus thermosulfidooxidans]|uniref:Probable membrane transporter protein n=1 Tax=Sulfobacillus thermosulfidooxidans TaxID=28034 RepID=A0A2T2X5W4_SULTH|nr:sulfite exporter TauE/SafE family protein [Sulfobacillus thermosulfidooxidans]PSR29838.1 MAG: sulfite exporter TauE/SafE family protein [Sulfobacillus thermosulfidooxidans]
MVHVTAIQQVLAVISGVIVGFSLGLIGGGGSIMAVPLLLYFVGIHDPHLVIGTTALAVAVNSYLNLIPHWRSGNVKWGAAIGFAIPGAVGAFIGSSIGKIVNGKDLLFLFALLMIVVAILMLKPKKGESTTTSFHWTHKMLLRVIPAGLLVGFVSGFFGIGGGFLIVPGLIMSTGMPMIYAIGSSLFSVGTFGLTTAINYAFSGLVLWLVVVEYVGGGIIGGVLGTRLANQLSKQKRLLNFVFSGVVIIVGIYMLTLNA